MKDYEINEWVEVAYCHLPGESILALCLFNTGKKIVFMTEKPDQYSYFEKLSKDKHISPSVTKIGGVSANGCLLITSTGIVGAFLMPDASRISWESPLKLNVTIESLGLSRMNLRMADLVYEKSHFYVITTNVSHTTAILQCYKIKVQLQKQRLLVSCFSIPSLFAAEGKGANLREISIHTAKWNIMDDSESVLTVLNHCYGTLIECFHLKEQTKNVRKPFLINKSEMFRTFQWVSSYFYQYNFQTASIHISTSPFKTSYIYISTTDNILHCLRGETLKDLYQVPTSIKDVDDKTNRFYHGVQTIVSTYLGYILILMNQNNGMIAFRLNLLFREIFSNNLTTIVNTIEYSIVNGNDYTDILLCLRGQNLDSVIDKLNENFNRQCQSFQQFFYTSFLISKINLYRIGQLGSLKVQDLNNLLTLHSILIAFKSLLRTSEFSILEGPPEKLSLSEALSLALSESLSEIDKVLVNLEVKDFAVESNVLLNLKQLIQWVADLALNILVRLPEQKLKAQSYDISRDIIALNSIRELLVIIRIWGLLKPQCLPTFTRSSENQDIIANLYKLLTKLCLNINELDEILLDECCALSSQVIISDTMFLNVPRLGLLSSAISITPTPLHFKFNRENDLYLTQLETIQSEKYLNTNCTIDLTCYLHFEKAKSMVRRCSRCGATTSIVNIPRTMAIRAWEQRWPYGCRCGGFWQSIE